MVKSSTTISMMAQTSDQFYFGVSFEGLRIANRTDTYLKSADERIRNVILEQVFPFAVFAAPSPDVVTVVVVLTGVQYGGAYNPHDDAEHEEGNGKCGVVDSNLFGSAVTVPAVRNDDKGSSDQRQRGDGNERHLWPDWGDGRPGGQTIAVG
jgi:hypothetical protein